MIIKDGNIEVEISNSNKPLMTDLFTKWGYDIEDVDPTEGLKVDNAYDIISELSAWGIPWKQINE